MPDLSRILLFIPGIVIFLVGTADIRKVNKMRRPESRRSGEVKHCKHIVEKDEKDREVFNFYEVQVDSVNPSSGKKEHFTINSPTEYSIRQTVRLSFDEVTGKPSFLNDIDERTFNPWVSSVCGRFSGSAKYTLQGIESTRRCNVNSSRKESFKEGEVIKLYFSPGENGIRERCANKVILIAGVLLSTAGILAALSILAAA